MKQTLLKDKQYTATRNACKVCAPLGACVAYKGVRGCIPLIHGSQGCATYVRRYLISHYKEPVDIASSGFSEEATIFGGASTCHAALTNMISQYKPELVGICTTCLSETIGDNMQAIVGDFESKYKSKTQLVYASTPSYSGTHADGFHTTVNAITRRFAKKTKRVKSINIFPGFLSPEDLRSLKEIISDFDIPFTMLPDYSETLDGKHWNDYTRMPEGGTSIDQITTMGDAFGSIEFGKILNTGIMAGALREDLVPETAAVYLESEFGVKRYNMHIPIGINATDKFMDTLAEISGNEIPQKYQDQRGRLVDAYVDGHKYVFGKRAIVYGEEDFVLGVLAFLSEIGVVPVAIASGGDSARMGAYAKAMYGKDVDMLVMSGVDFETIHDRAADLKPDILIGNSKGYYIARDLNIPIVRVGFPIHDRLGGQRILHVGYEGTHRLFEEVANTLIEYKQENSPVGYKYM